MEQEDKLGLFFGPDNKTEPKKEVTTKDWSSDWLRMKEANLMEQGTSLNNPYSQSYIAYTAIRRIAENIPQAKYKIIDISTERPVGFDNPVQKLFLNPNPFMSRFEFWEAIGTYLNLDGEVFLYPVESVGGVLGRGTAPAEIWVLDPKMVSHSLDQGVLAGWSWNGKVPFEMDELIHLRLFNPGAANIRGLSPISSAKNEMAADYAAGAYNNQFFKNNATPDGVIEIDKDKEIDIKDLRKLKKMWYENHGSVENSHKTAFLMGGMTYKPSGFTQKDMDYVQGRGFSRDAVLSVFGVHPFVAGFYDSGTVTRATAREAKRLFWTSTLKPMLIRIEEKLAVKFFPKHAPGLVGVFDYSEVEELQEDYDQSVLTAKELFSIGYTRNEINERMRLGMPHLDEGDNDTRYLPINLMPTDETTSEPAQIDDPDKSLKEKSNVINKINRYRRNFLHFQQQMEKLLQAKLKRFLYSQRVQLLKLLKTGFKADLTPEQMQMIADIKVIFEDGKEVLMTSVEPIYRQAITEAGEMAYRNIGLAADREFLVNEEILTNRLNMISGINDTLYDKVKTDIYAGVKQGETITQISERVKAIYNTTSNRAKVIARTETASMMNATSELIYREEGIQQKIWITAGDDDVRESHRKVGSEPPVPIGRVFSNGLLYPGDPNGSAQEVINCRCSIAPYILVEE